MSTFWELNRPFCYCVSLRWLYSMYCKWPLLRLGKYQSLYEWQLYPYSMNYMFCSVVFTFHYIHYIRFHFNTMPVFIINKYVCKISPKMAQNMQKHCYGTCRKLKRTTIIAQNKTWSVQTMVMFVWNSKPIFIFLLRSYTFSCVVFEDPGHVDVLNLDRFYNTIGKLMLRSS